MQTIKTIIQSQSKKEISTPPTTKIIQNHSNIATTTPKLNFEDCIHLLQKAGKAKYGPHFKINADDYEIIYKLIIYAIKDENTAKKLNLNLKKGILLSGPVGCGKTTLLTLINYFQKPVSQYIMKPCREISFEFIQDGYETIHKYSKNSFHFTNNVPTNKTYCFDDLGVENNLKYFGNECNVMAEIILSRYDLFIQKQLITHITTNLSATEIENLYGARVRSRMREMFNLISFNKNAPDKRL